MPRQITPDKLRRDRRRGTSPVPRRRKRVRTGSVVSRRPPDGGTVNKIGKVVNSLAKTSMIATPDKNTDMKDLSRSIISSLGAGVVTEISEDTVSKDDSRTKRKIPLNTRFSLKMTQTDRTVIPNDQISDLKSIKKQFSKSPMISARTIFPNFEQNTMFEPQPQVALKKVVQEQQILKAKQTSNLIDIMGEIVRLQEELKPDMKLPVFNYTKKVLDNPNIDNSNYEFKDYSDPSLNYDDDLDETINI